MKSRHWGLYRFCSTALVILTLAVGCSDTPQNPPQVSQSKQATVPTAIAIAPAFRPIPILYVVNSYDPKSFDWTKGVIGGIAQGLADGGLKLDVDFQMVSEIMDTLTHTTHEQMQAQASRILADIKTRKPDLVLTTDDDALTWVELALDDMPVVFNGATG